MVAFRARYGTNGFRTEPAAPPVVLESVPVLARTRGFRRCLGTYGSNGYGPVRVRVLRVQPGRDTGPTGTEPGGGHANGICAETRPMGDTRGPGSRAHGKPASRGAVGGRPGERGSCACTCTQGGMYHAAWYTRMSMRMTSDMRMHMYMHVGVRMACGPAHAT